MAGTWTKVHSPAAILCLLCFGLLAGAAHAHAHRHSGAISLPASRIEHRGSLVCGFSGGRWIPGAITSRGQFLSVHAEARHYSARARHAHGHARRAALARARSLGRRASRLLARCRPGAGSATPTTPVASPALLTPGTTAPPTLTPVGDRNITIAPEFFGQHLMFDSTLQPAVPVHAMRLWDSNTQWCQMDRGTSTGEYDFTQLDLLLAQSDRVGADVEYTFGYTPRWAADGSYPQSSASDQCSPSTDAQAPADESSWTNFVTALVEHAAGRIHAYELWNEVDSTDFWSGGIANMVRMTVDAAAIIHRLDPTALVLSPSITATPSGYAFLQQYLAALPAGTIDAIAVHGYTFGAWPEAAVPAALASVHAALPADYANTPIWSTEGGWGENSWFSSAAADQRAFVARYDLQMLIRGVTRAYWYAYPNTQWGGLWDGTQLTPAGQATNAVESWLTGATLAGCATDGSLWACDITTSAGASARIVWSTSAPVTYPVGTFSTVSRLDGTSVPIGGSSLTVTGEPVLLT